VEGALVGNVLFYGEGAGASATSSAMVADVVSAARDIVTGTGTRARWRLVPNKKIRPMAELETRYYLRLNVDDQPGVLAQVSKVLGDHRISISSVIQKAIDDKVQTAEIVIMTHPAKEAEMQQALKELERMASVKEIGNFIRVEG
jgi:homoserine dehydrogenase